MNGTDELRERAKALTHWWYDPVKDEYTYTTYIMPPSIDAIRLDSNIIAIADRIDAEHEAMLVDARKTVYQGYIELPKDADGKHIQPSDIPHLTKANDGKRLAFCPSLELRQDGTWSFAGWTPDMYRISKPTVEDVLREFANEVYADADNEIRDRDFLCAKYAKRLTLAEGEDA